MQFSKVIGYKEVIENLRNMVDSNRLPHAFLFTEKRGYGAITLVLSTIQYLLCQNKIDGDSCGVCPKCTKIAKLTHPDVHFSFPTNSSTLISKDKKEDVDLYYPLWRNLVLENLYFSEQELYKALGIENKQGTISVKDASTIISKLSLSSYEGGAKVMIILFPERMNQDSANKLLKSLEEPQPDTYYFLISHSPSKIISTILSRCRRVELPPIEQKELTSAIIANNNLPEEEAKFITKCSGGSYGYAQELISSNNQHSEATDLFLQLLNNAISKDLVKLIEIWENLATWRKEAQKEFCREGLQILRKLYILDLNLPDISYSPKLEREELENLSGKIKSTFYQKGYTLLNEAVMQIEQNINPKFIFCDLCNRIYYNI